MGVVKRDVPSITLDPSITPFDVVFGMSALPTIFCIFVGEFTLSESIMTGVMPYSLLIISATCWIPIPYGLMLSDAHAGHFLGISYCVLQIWQSPNGLLFVSV